MLGCCREESGRESLPRGQRNPTFDREVYPAVEEIQHVIGRVYPTGEEIQLTVEKVYPEVELMPRRGRDAIAIGEETTE